MTPTVPQILAVGTIRKAVQEVVKEQAAKARSGRGGDLARPSDAPKLEAALAVAAVAFTQGRPIDIRVAMAELKELVDEAIREAIIDTCPGRSIPGWALRRLTAPD